MSQSVRCHGGPHAARCFLVRRRTLHVHHESAVIAHPHHVRMGRQRRPAAPFPRPGCVLRHLRCLYRGSSRVDARRAARCSARCASDREAAGFAGRRPRACKDALTLPRREDHVDAAWRRPRDRDWRRSRGRRSWRRRRRRCTGVSELRIWARICMMQLLFLSGKLFERLMNRLPLGGGELRRRIIVVGGRRNRNHAERKRQRQKFSIHALFYAVPPKGY